MKNYYIDGNSVFASRKLEKYEPVGVAFIVTESDITPHNIGEFLTHSDLPNCRVKRAGNFVRIDTIQDIREGSELTVDFNEFNFGPDYKVNSKDTRFETAGFVQESSVEEDLITGTEDEEEPSDEVIPNGLYTPNEIFEKSKSLPVHALLDDEKYREWFEYYQRRTLKLEAYNADMEAYWYKTVTEALESGDEDTVIAHGWEPTLPLNSSNLYSASIRLENAINDVTINEYNYCGKDFSAILEEAEEKNLVPVYVMLTASPTPMGSAIRKVTNSKVSHSALSFDPELESMISFNMAGLIRESRSKYIKQYGEDMQIAVYVIFITPEQKSLMQATCSDMIKNADKWKYNLKGLFGTLLNKPIGKGNVMFCSEFVDRVFKAAGIRLTDKKYSGTVTPDDFYKSKSKNVFKIFDGNIGDYKEADAKAKTTQYKGRSEVPIEHSKVDLKTVKGEEKKKTSRELDTPVKEYYVEVVEEGYTSPLFSPNYILAQTLK